ncbi:MAG: GTP-binding protein [Phycisphaerales bacterium]|nr:GTP-binding protein [Phycisphaerales bacterium]
MMPPSSHSAILLTPPGAGAIAVIRVVGVDAPVLVSEIFRGQSATALSGEIGDRLLYGRVVDGDEVIDDVLVSLAKSTSAGRPTGSGHAVDISCHGGIRVVERILQVLESRGVTIRDDAGTTFSTWPARNLVEREALEAIAAAKTGRAVRFAARLRTHLVPHLDELADRFAADPSAARRELETLVAGFSAARVLLDGVTVALVGPPNSGKSTLFNRLVGRTAAVTSPIPGTTRDWVAESVEIEGVPVTLIDTAGRHRTAESLERLAVECGLSRIQSADVILPVLETSRELGNAEKDVLTAMRTGWFRVIVANKSDLEPVWSKADLQGIQPSIPSELVRVSAITGLGCSDLLQRLLERLGVTGFDDSRVCLFTERQAGIAYRALSAVPPHAGDMIRTELIGG